MQTGLFTGLSFAAVGSEHDFVSALAGYYSPDNARVRTSKSRKRERTALDTPLLKNGERERERLLRFSVRTSGLSRSYRGKEEEEENVFQHGTKCKQSICQCCLALDVTSSMLLWYVHVVIHGLRGFDFVSFAHRHSHATRLWTGHRRVHLELHADHRSLP
jgi:hypothetical protein